MKRVLIINGDGTGLENFAIRRLYAQRDKK